MVTKLGFVFRYSPALRRLRELVREGYVGRPHTLIVYSQNPQFLDPSAPLHWKMERARTGGGVFVEYGSHSLDLARWIVGELTEVCANMRTVVPERPDPRGGPPRAVDVDDVCSWLASLDGGVEAVFHASWASLAQPWGDLAVFGDAGALVWRRRDDAWPFAELLGATAAVPGSRAAGPAPPAHRGPRVGDDVAGVLHGESRAPLRGRGPRGAPPEGPTFLDGYRAQLALDALATSAGRAALGDRARLTAVTGG